MIEIFWKDISKITPKKYDKYLSFLPKLMHVYIIKYRVKEDRYRSVAGKILLLKYLKKNTPFNLSHIETNPYGKPYIPHSNLSFNISHSGRFVVALFSHSKQVGVDIEEIKSIDIDDFKMVLSKDEFNQIQNSSNRLEAFYTLWTAKEAILKSEGRGLIDNLEDIVIKDNRAFFEKREYTIETFIQECYIYTIAYP